MAWQLTLEDGQVVREDDLTIAEVEAMEERSGLTWRQLNPLRSAAVAKAILSTLYERRDGLTRDAADKKVDEMKSSTVVDMVGVYDPAEGMPTMYENGIPQSGAETSTPT